LLRKKAQQALQTQTALNPLDEKIQGDLAACTRE
jgi:hypothetical protein